jgi:bifunctional non-homologous end joining protein LigD
VPETNCAANSGASKCAGPRGSEQASLGKASSSFNLNGKRLKGSWVPVRMRSGRFKGKRNSWLLIKHRDEFARPGDGDALLAEDRSVTSGRPRAAISSAVRPDVPQPLSASSVEATCERS